LNVKKLQKNAFLTFIPHTPSPCPVPPYILILKTSNKNPHRAVSDKAAGIAHTMPAQNRYALQKQKQNYH
jgi:hypothetical protein